MIIIVFGLPGTGKTTFAKGLSRLLGAAHINSDQVRHASRKRGMYDFNVKQQVYEEMFDLMERALESRDTVVLDATFFKESLRNRVLQHPCACHTLVVFIEITADEAEIAGRSSHKRRYSETDRAVQEGVKRDFEPMEMDHLVLDSSAYSLEQMLEQALSYLSVYRHERIGNRTNTR